jgi:hypothetical protein
MTNAIDLSFLKDIQIKPKMTSRERDDIVQQVIANYDDDDEELYVKIERAVMMRQIEVLSEALQRYTWALERNSDSIISFISRGINDYASAHDAKEIYTEEWFSTLVLTDDVKVRLANALIERCQQYLGQAFPRLWTRIASGHPETMKKIKFEF